MSCIHGLFPALKRYEEIQCNQKSIRVEKIQTEMTLTVSLVRMNLGIPLLHRQFVLLS